MRYYACHNNDCVNKGAPYHDEQPREVIVLCPCCDTAMQTIPAPDLSPPAIEPAEGGE